MPTLSSDTLQLHPHLHLHLHLRKRRSLTCDCRRPTTPAPWIFPRVACVLSFVGKAGKCSRIAEIASLRTRVLIPHCRVRFDEVQSRVVSGASFQASISYLLFQLRKLEPWNKELFQSYSIKTVIRPPGPVLCCILHPFPPLTCCSSYTPGCYY